MPAKSTPGGSEPMDFILSGLLWELSLLLEWVSNEPRQQRADGHDGRALARSLAEQIRWLLPADHIPGPELDRDWLRGIVAAFDGVPLRQVMIRNTNREREERSSADRGAAS